MCDPVSIGLATTALSIASTVTAYMGQKQAYKANQTAANLDAANKFNIREQNRVQGDQKSAEDRLSLAVEAAQSFGRISNSASTLGLGASTTAQALNASAVATGRATAIGDQNFLFARSQYANDLHGDELSRIDRINSVENPSPVQLALGIGKAALGGFNASQTSAALKARAA